MTFDKLSFQDFSQLNIGDLVYYADWIACSTEKVHLLQLAQVTSATDKIVALDNGKKFSIGLKVEICRGNGGALFVYNAASDALVKDAQSKLGVLLTVQNIDFSSLSLQQLLLIRDVANGAFTQVSNPCNGGCGDTVRVAGIDIDISDIEPLVTVFDDDNVSSSISIPEATYELSDEDDDDYEDECASGHTA